MILPTKTIAPARCLIGIGAVVIRLMNEPKPVSRIWQEFKHVHETVPGAPTVTFSHFVLALDLLFILGAIELRHGRLVRQQ
jgi:hypothetical protein